jgi:hypothetical protein
LLDCVAGAVVVAGAALCASAGAVNMVAAISTAANFLNMVVSFRCILLRAGPMPALRERVPVCEGALNSP